jgi:hypothetical protein
MDNHVDDERDPVLEAIDALIKRRRYLEAIEYALSQDMLRSAVFIAMQHEAKLVWWEKIRVCQVLAGLAGEETCPDPNLQSAQALAGHWLIIRDCQRHGVDLYPRPTPSTDPRLVAVDTK